MIQRVVTFTDPVNRLYLFLLLAAAIPLTGCQGSLELGQVLNRLLPSATLPDCVNSDCNCADFASQPDAQRVLEAYDGDPFDLDADGNGSACESLPEVAPGQRAASAPDSDHLLLGNPSDASATNPNDYLVQRPEYALSYSASRGTANWVSWHLSEAWLGPIDRQDDFQPDPLLPSGVYAVRPGDYRGSGYDRGHLVPSGDRTVTQAANSATFIMSNIVPQTPENNREVWRRLEEYSRQLAGRGRELYIVAGVYGEQGRIADGTVVVPTHLWKVAVVLPEGGDLDDVDVSTPVIAVDIPNSDRLEGWGNYLTTVDVIESRTGYDLLSALPRNVQAAIESRQFRGL